MSLRFFLVAGEASGDFLGAELMRALKKTTPHILFSGVGGALMKAEGLESLFPMEELSLIGLSAILRNYRALRRRLFETIEAAIAENPDAVITIDAQEFSARLMREIKARAPHIRTVHYVAPTVWAWRPRRAQALAKIADQLLALFPFEQPYFERHGLRCDFVGHPLAMTSRSDEAAISAFKQKFKIDKHAPILAVLPGSRTSEIAYHAPILSDTLTRMFHNFPNLRVLVPMVESQAQNVKEKAANWPGAPIFLDPSIDYGAPFDQLKQTALSAADLALAASGTVTLELAAARTPMVVFYKLRWLSYMVALMLKVSNRICLVNIVAARDIIPELVGGRCRAESIEKCANALLASSAARKAQIDAMDRVMQALGQDMPDAPSTNAARAILDGLKPPPKAHLPT